MSDMHLVGNLVKDPIHTGESSVILVIARKQKDKVDYTDVFVYGKLAETCKMYLSKGRMVHAQITKSTIKDKETGYSKPIFYLDKIEFLGGKDRDEQKEIVKKVTLSDLDQEALFNADDIPF